LSSAIRIPIFGGPQGSINTTQIVLSKKNEGVEIGTKSTQKQFESL